MQKDRVRISASEKDKCKNDDVGRSIKDLQDKVERKKAIESQKKKNGGGASASTNNNKSGGGTQSSSNTANKAGSNTSQPS